MQRLALALLLALTCAMADEPPQPRSCHHRLKLEHRDLKAVEVDVRVDEVPAHGLRFFALQVNFANGTWAHGGFQRDPSDGRVNWGGLLGGVDYQFAGQARKVLAQIQNGPKRLDTVHWRTRRWYRYRVERGPQEVLPAGDYAVLDEKPVRLDTPRTLTRWDFVILDLEQAHEVWRGSLHVNSDRITGYTYWTETGYGIRCDDRLTVRWRNPYAWRVDGSGPFLPLNLRTSLRQSNCPQEQSTDMRRDPDSGGAWGTVQRYGGLRIHPDDHVLYRRVATPSR